MPENYEYLVMGLFSFNVIGGPAMTMENVSVRFQDGPAFVQFRGGCS